MKKLAAILLCLVLVASLCVTSVSAATNYCSLFQSNVRALRWDLEIYGNGINVSEGQAFPMDVIVYHIKTKLQNDYYNEQSGTLEIPADVFESKAKKVFAIVDLNQMRAHQIEVDWEGSQPIMGTCYNAQKNAYVFPGFGGLGDSTTYATRGYVKNGSKYTVYSDFIDLAEADNVPAGGVEGKDYVVFENAKYEIMHTVKTVVETDGTNVKFHSWEKVNAPATINGLITPSTVVEDEKSATSQPSNTTSKPTTSQPAASTPTTGATSSDATTSEVTSSETTSSEEEKPMVTVAEIKTAKLETAENVFPENTVVKVEEVQEEKKIETVKEALKEVSDTFVAYEITATCENVSVQPDGKVKATFEIPEGYDLSKVAVFYVAPDGKFEKLQSTVNKETNTVVAELSHFSTYVVAETFEETDNEVLTTGGEKNEDNDKGGNLVLWIVLAVGIVLVIGGGVAGVFFLKKKENAAAEEQE